MATTVRTTKDNKPRTNRQGLPVRTWNRLTLGVELQAYTVYDRGDRPVYSTNNCRQAHAVARSMSNRHNAEFAAHRSRSAIVTR